MLCRTILGDLLHPSPDMALLGFLSGMNGSRTGCGETIRPVPRKSEVLKDHGGGVEQRGSVCVSDEGKDQHGNKQKDYEWISLLKCVI